MDKKTKNTTGFFLVILFACLSYSPLLAQTEEEYLENVEDYMESISDQKILADFFLVTSICAVSPDFAQDNPKTLADIFMGKWQGNVQFDVKLFDKKGKIDSYYTSSLNNINIVATAERASKNPFNGIAVFTGVSQFYDRKGRVFDTWKLKNGTENIEIWGHFFSNNRIWITSNSTVEIEGSAGVGEDQAFSFSAVSWGVAIIEGIDFEIKDNSLVVNYEGKPVGGEENDYIKITGELRRIHTKKDTLGKTVFVDEPIKTDKFTQNDIVIPDVGEVKIKPQSECKFNNENSLEHFKGTIRHKVRKMKKDDVNFEIRSPQAVIGVRGTEFITNVVKDSTTLRVLEGQVELSDINHNKTVVVKQNQMSTVKAGGVPSEPVEIGTITKWRELH